MRRRLLGTQIDSFYGNKMVVNGGRVGDYVANIDIYFYVTKSVEIITVLNNTSERELIVDDKSHFCPP